MRGPAPAEGFLFAKAAVVFWHSTVLNVTLNEMQERGSEPASARAPGRLVGRSVGRPARPLPPPAESLKVYLINVGL